MAKDHSTNMRGLRSGGVAAGLGLFGGVPTAAMSGLEAYVGQHIGDSLLGIPKEHTFLNEAGRGATGNGIIGAGIGATGGAIVSSIKKDNPLLKFLMKNGVSRAKAAAILIGGMGAAAGASGALSGGISSGLANRDW